MEVRTGPRTHGPGSHPKCLQSGVSEGATIHCPESCAANSPVPPHALRPCPENSPHARSELWSDLPDDRSLSGRPRILLPPRPRFPPLSSDSRGALPGSPRPPLHPASGSGLRGSQAEGGEGDGGTDRAHDGEPGPRVRIGAGISARRPLAGLGQDPRARRGREMGSGSGPGPGEERLRRGRRVGPRRRDGAQPRLPREAGRGVPEGVRVREQPGPGPAGRRSWPRGGRRQGRADTDPK